MKKIILLSILVSFFSCSDSTDERGYSVKVGDKAPKIDLELLDGRKLTNENLKGKVSCYSIHCFMVWCLYKRNATSRKRGVAKI